MMAAALPLHVVPVILWTLRVHTSEALSDPLRVAFLSRFAALSHTAAGSIVHWKRDSQMESGNFKGVSFFDENNHNVSAALSMQTEALLTAAAVLTTRDGQHRAPTLPIALQRAQHFSDTSFDLQPVDPDDLDVEEQVHFLTVAQIDELLDDEIPEIIN